MEVYAMDALYVVNVGREREPNCTLPTANSTVDVPTAVKTTHPMLEHVQSREPKKNEILTVKHTRNIPYPEARKIVEGYIKHKTYSQIHAKSESTKGDNYQELFSKLFQLGPQDWPKFIPEIKPILLKLFTNSTGGVLVV